MSTMNGTSLTKAISQLLETSYSSNIMNDFHQYCIDEQYDSDCLKDDINTDSPFFLEHIISKNTFIFSTAIQKEQLIANIKQLFNQDTQAKPQVQTSTPSLPQSETKTETDTFSDSDGDIEELYATHTTANNNTLAIANSPFKILNKIQNKRAWFNAQNLHINYTSVNPNIIPSLTLSDLNHRSFRNQYAYAELTHNCHWLIPDRLLIGEDPTGFVPVLVKNKFTAFVSLHEWKHASYKKDIKQCCQNMDEIELIAFTIRDFDTVNDKQTFHFVQLLLQKILKVKKDSKIYMHCFGGHGRTGLISSLLLQAIYGMDSDISIKFLNEIHRARHSYCDSDRMPESSKQKKQVQRLQRNMKRMYDKYSAMQAKTQEN